MTKVHPLYAEHQDEWAEYRLCYEGGRPYLDRYIIKHRKEPADYFAERLARSVHINHTRAVVDTYAAHLYRESIARTPADEPAARVLQQLWDDMDLLGNEANEFYEQAAQLVQRGGRVAIVVDRTNGNALTRADELAQGIRPYTYLVDTENIVDWDVDARGIVQWVKLREPADQRREWNEDHPGIAWQYRVWTPTEWVLIVEDTQESDDGKTKKTVERIVDRGPHPCGEVPVVFVFWGRRPGGELIAPAAVRDIAPLNRRLTNLQSLIDEQIAAHVFNIMAVPESTWEQLGKVDFSAFGAVPYPDDVSQPPHYIGPDVSKIEFIRSEIEKAEAAIRLLSGLGRVNEDTKHVQTGIALSYLTMDKDALLAKFASRMSAAEAYVDWLALKWMGLDPDGKATRQYPTSFDPGDLESELSAALRFATLVTTGEAAIENIVIAAKARFAPHIESERLAVVIEDLRTRLGQAELRA